MRKLTRILSNEETLPAVTRNLKVLSLYSYHGVDKLLAAQFTWFVFDLYIPKANAGIFRFPP